MVFRSNDVVFSLLLLEVYLQKKKGLFLFEE